MLVTPEALQLILDIFIDAIQVNWFMILFLLCIPVGFALVIHYVFDAFNRKN